MSSGTFISSERSLDLSTFEMYEFHTTQEATGVHPPPSTSITRFSVTSQANGEIPSQDRRRIEQRQTTATTGPEITAKHSRIATPSTLSIRINRTFPRRKASLGVKYFAESRIDPRSRDIAAIQRRNHVSLRKDMSEIELMTERRIVHDLPIRRYMRCASTTAMPDGVDAKIGLRRGISRPSEKPGGRTPVLR
jgi:hypothetical protein